MTITNYAAGKRLLFIGATIALSIPQALASVTVSGSASPASVAVGASETFKVSIKSSTARKKAVVDLEILDSKGSEIAQDHMTAQKLPAGKAVSYSWTYAVPAGSASGQYFLEVEVFTAGGKNLYSNSDVASYSVGPMPSPSPSPSVKPSPSPSPSPSATASACEQNSSSIVITKADLNQGWTNGINNNPVNEEPANPPGNFGYNVVSADDWGGDPGLSMWINSPSCWSASTTTDKDSGSPGEYPDVSVGFSEPGGSPFNGSWITKSGLGISVGDIASTTAPIKVHTHWAMTVPESANVNDSVSRWDALIDIYFESSATSDAFVPLTDLQIMQTLMDEPIGGGAADMNGYWAYTAATCHPFVKTISGVTYLGCIDGGNGGFNKAGGHTITLWPTPTMYTNPSGSNPLFWGPTSVTHDIGGIIAWFNESNPTDDSGNPIKTGNGKVVTSPILPSNVYLNSINAGFEIDFGTAPNNNTWTTTNFWVSIGNEPDGPASP